MDGDLIKLPALVQFAQRREFPHKLGICERLFGRALARHGVCWVQTAAGIPWKLDLGSVTHRWIVYGKYEGGAFLDWARAHLAADSVVVDSGANIGQMALYLAQWIPNGRLLAFEPGRTAREWLEQCLRRNATLPVEVLPVALGAAPARMTLKQIGGETLHGSWNQVTDGEGEPTEVKRLADVLSELQVSTVDLWKLDVEGYEPMALEGARSLLERRSVRAIYAELGFGNGPKIRDYLAKYGYRCYVFAPSGSLHSAGELPEHTNALFLPDSL